MMVSNRNLLFQGSIFRGYVSFKEGNHGICTIQILGIGSFWSRFGIAISMHPAIFGGQQQLVNATYIIYTSQISIPVWNYIGTIDIEKYEIYSLPIAMK